MHNKGNFAHASKESLIVKTTIINTAVDTVENVLLNAFNMRFLSCVQHGLDNQATVLINYLHDHTAENMNLAQVKLIGSDFERIAKIYSTVDDKGKGLEQVKTIDKMLRICEAVATGLDKKLDSFCKYIAVNTLEMNGILSTREGICTLSKAAHKNADIFGVREGFRNLSSYTVGTGVSQSSQVRQCFNQLGFFVEGTFKKGRKDDKPELNQYGRDVLTNMVFKQVTK